MKRWLLLLPLLILLAGCSRAYTLMGTVLFLEASPHSSITEVVGSAIPTIGGVPIENAQVTLFHELTNNLPVRDSIWQDTIKTDKNGQFQLRSNAKPGNANLVGLEVSAPGYEAAFTIYIDYIDPDEQYFLVILRKAG